MTQKCIWIFQIFGDEPRLGGTSLGSKMGTSVGWGIDKIFARWGTPVPPRKNPPLSISQVYLSHYYINFIPLRKWMWRHIATLHNRKHFTAPFCSRARISPRPDNIAHVSVLSNIKYAVTSSPFLRGYSTPRPYFWRLCIFSQKIKHLWTKYPMDLVRNVPRNSKRPLLWSYIKKNVRKSIFSMFLVIIIINNLLS